MPTFLRYLLSILSITIIFGSFVIAPMTVWGAKPRYETLFVPGEMPSQQIIAAAAKEAELYLETLESEYIPEPEPEPEPEPMPVQVQQPAPVPQYSGGGSPEVWMSAAGISPSDWGYVDFIAARESGWNPNATNPSSGACGLIQAYPCSKVPGGGYDPVSNLTWANGYATSRYGSWQAAYNFWTQNSWW